MAVSKRLRYEVFRRDNHTCVYCGRSAPDVKLQPDHVVPEALGGRTEPANLVTACEDCNAGKSATPPDAATVESASDSAVRWAGAMRAAADAALADLNAREETREEFLEKWNSWKAGDATMPLPGNWADSVDRFLAAGLPMPILLDCVDRAMSKPKIKAADLFRYMCGIAWSRVNDLQKSAREIAETGASPAIPQGQPLEEGRAHFARELLQDHLPDDQWEAALRQAVIRLGGDANDESVLTDAAYETFGEAYRAQGLLDETVDTLLGLFPADDVARCRAAALREAREFLGDDEIEPSVLKSGTADYLRAYAYFNGLPEAQRQAWMTCVAAAPGEEGTIPDDLDVARYALQCKERGPFARPGMCVRNGEHGAMCPNRSAYLIEVKDCSLCTELGRDDCGRHPMCTEHATEVIDGKFIRRATGEAVEAQDFTELEGVH